MTPILNPRTDVAARTQPSSSPARRIRRACRLGRALALTACLLPFSSAMALNTTYYIDSAAGLDSPNNGTHPDTPWKTLAKVSATTFGPGDKILFKRGGQWSGTVILASEGGSAGTPLLLDCYGDPADPLPSLQGANGATLRLWNMSHTTIQNLDLRNDPALTGFSRKAIHLIYQVAGSYSGIKILNNQIHNVYGYTTRANGMNYGNATIYVEYQGAECLVSDVLIQGNEIRDCKNLGFYVHGAAFLNGAPDKWIKGLVLRNNLFTKMGGDHIVVQCADAPVIEYNAGFDAGHPDYTNASEDPWIAGMWVCHDTRNSLFQYNEVARTRNHYLHKGDSMAFDVDYGTVGNHIFQYNYTHDNAGGALLMMPPKEGFLPAQKTIVYRYNISVNDDRNNLSGRQVVLDTAPGTNSAHVYNNVFYNNRKYGLKMADSSSADNYFNNVFYASSGHYGSVGRYSNNCYFGHSPVVNDDYKVLDDPKFVGPLPGTAQLPDIFVVPKNSANWASVRTANNIFKLQTGSPLINRGKTITTPISNGGFDFWGNPLYSGAADIGAHEVPGGQGATPAAVTIIDDPSNPPVVTYSGTWENLNTGVPSWEKETVSKSATLGSAVVCSFTGTNVTLGAMRGPGSGKVRIIVDTRPYVDVDLYWAASLTRQDVFQITGLANTSHTIRVQVIEKNPMSTSRMVHIDCFKVSTDNIPAPPAVTIADDTAGTFDAGWAFTTTATNGYNKTLRTATAPGSTATFNFTGTGVRVYGPRDGTGGNMNITVNGVTKAVSCFSYGSWPETATRLYEVAGLPYGSYTLTAVVTAKDSIATTGAVAIDSFEVLNERIMDDVPSSSVVYTTAPGKLAWKNLLDPLFYRGTKSTSDQIDNYVTYTFYGTGASIYAKKDSGLGRLRVEINGVTTTADCYSPVPLMRQRVFDVYNLPLGTYTLKATITTRNPQSASNNIGLDYFRYQP